MAPRGSTQEAPTIAAIRDATYGAGLSAPENPYKGWTMHQPLISVPRSRRWRDVHDTIPRRLAPSPEGPPALEHPSAAATWLTDVVRQCQVIAGAAIDQSPEQLLALFSTAIRRVPADASGLDATLARDVLLRTVGRIIRTVHLDENADISRAFIETSCIPSTGAWQSALLAITQTCTTPLRPAHEGVRESSTSSEENRYVRETLIFIEHRFRDPRCDLKAAAASVRLTASHVSRILRRETGEGFVSHLRRRRAQEARRLLNASSFSIKEIAAAVGYQSRRQFERDFRRLWRLTPASLREGEVAQANM